MICGRIEGSILLSRLRIVNFIIIDELEVDFSNGFNVITGETGAGKSIIIGAIEILLGKKVSKTLIKKTKKMAQIQGVFELENSDIKSKYGIDENGCGDLIISREIKDNGKSIAKINGEIVTLAELKLIAENLVTIFAQDDKMKFLKPSEQLSLYDSYVFPKTDKNLDKLKKLYLDLTKVRERLNNTELDVEKYHREKEFIEFQMKEIDDAELTELDEKLDDEVDYFNNIKEVITAHNEIYQMFDDDDFSVFTALSRIENRITYLAGFNDEYSKLLESFNDMYYGLKDINAELLSILENIEVDEEKAYLLEKRRDMVNTLKLKYGNSVAEIYKYREKLDKDYQKLESQYGDREKLRQEEAVLLESYQKIANTVSDKRKKAVKKFESQITESLKELNFKEAEFKVAIQQTAEIAKTGIDNLSFMVKLNSGLDFESLKKVASGGELSRIMLAIWEVISDRYNVPLLIFDEIDTGVGGKTANKLAEKLYKVSVNHQVLSITHLLQLAIYADSHYYIEKIDDGSMVDVKLTELDEAMIIDEIQRLIGRETSDSLRAEAIEMKKMANDMKMKIKNI